MKNALPSGHGTTGCGFNQHFPNEVVFYACATVEFVGIKEISFGDGMPLPWNGVAHFYVRTDDEIIAGSHIVTMCAQNGLKFLEYVYMPAEEQQATVHPLDEHRVAYDLADKSGEALVLTFVIDQNRIFVNLKDV